jgi:hypothetical protein
VALTVLPISNIRTASVITYTRSDSAPARKELSRLLKSTGQMQRYELSRRVLNHSENFILSPTFYNSWGRDKVEAVRRYFLATLFENDLESESEHLDLFWSPV